MKLEVDGIHLPNQNNETIDSAIAHLNLIKIQEMEGDTINSVNVHKVWDGDKNHSLVIKVDYQE